MIINTIINITLIREVIKVEIKECKGMDGVKKGSLFHTFFL